MSWKMTAAFAVLLAVALGVYLLRAPDAGSGADGGSQGGKLMPELVADRVTRIEVLRQSETATTIERAMDSVGDYWRIAPPVDKPADPSLVREMVLGVDRFVKAGGMDPGKPGTAPAITGLDQPRLIVTFHGPQQKETIRFGKQPPTNSTAVFFQKEGDSRIYLAAQEVFDAYDKPPLSLREKQLARFNPHQVVKVELRKKFIHGKQGEPARVEYESSLFERLEGAERGWWLVKPHRERLDDLKVMMLVTDLSKMPIEDWRLAGDVHAQGFNEPSDQISLWRYGSDTPITVLFGDVDEKTKRFALVEGSGQVARVDLNRYDRLPLQRNHFRPIIVFPFSRDALKTFRLEAGEGGKDGKVFIERLETKDKQTGLVTASWELIEPDPKTVKIDKDRLENFVGSVMGLRIEKDGFLGKQDFKNAGLDKPQITLTLETRDGKKHLCYFTLGSAAAFMRREGVDEVFMVHQEMVALMKRLELYFLHPEIFNVPRASLREFTFDSRTAGLERLYYSVRFDAEKGKWNFVKPASLVQNEPNGNMMAGILAVMNYIQAGSFIGRDAAAAKEHNLNDRVAPSTLTVVHDGGTAVFYISKDQSDRPTHPIYYARQEDSSVIFQISSPFVEGLKKLPEMSRGDEEPKKQKPEEQKK